MKANYVYYKRRLIEARREANKRAIQQSSGLVHVKPFEEFMKYWCLNRTILFLQTVAAAPN